MFSSGEATAPALSARLERIRKVLLHEQRLGWTDRAVVGGLERFLQHAAAQCGPAERTWCATALSQVAGYASADPARRERMVKGLLKSLPQATTGGSAPPAVSVVGGGDTIASHTTGGSSGARRPFGVDTQDAAGHGVLAKDAAGDVDGRVLGDEAVGAGHGGMHRRSVNTVRARAAVLAKSSVASRTAGTATAGTAIVSTSGQTVRSSGSGGTGRTATRRAASAAVVVAKSPQAPVGELPGIGPKSTAALGKLGVVSIKDLLYHLPRRHLDRRSVTRIADLLPGQTATVFASVWQVQTKRSPVQRLMITDAILQDDSGYCHAVWFNQPYLSRTLSRPGQIMFSGKVEYASGGGPQLAAPEFEFDSDDLLHTGRLVPFYHKTEGLSDKQLRAWVRLALEATAAHLYDPLPSEVRAAEGLPSLREALQQAHFPDDDEALAQALRRLAFDEFLLIQLGVLRRRRDWQESQPGIAMAIAPGTMEEFRQVLPFELTRAQRRVVDEILGDMARPVPMSRLLQGEVGSGKTVVAAAACLAAIRSGYQAAMMAPTEVLAQQHFRSVTKLLEPFGVRVGMVTGSQRKKEKAAVWEASRTGELDLLVGTHALIQEEGEFLQLGLAVVDEQHRFGVRQRGALRQKGYNPDLLVMTATPIPRTLALSIYGDLDLSVIDERPPGRQIIKTYWVAPPNRHKAYDFLRRQVRSGRQAFIICPLIEDSEKIEARSAKSEYERLQRQFPDLRLALLHGKMSPKEKEAVMTTFRDGAADVLVSTAVVEVGIDVPNATIMLIEGADRFGLSQLHQFRGRVGRGEHQSYCLLLSDSADAESNPRLKVLTHTHDGFVLAEEDLKLRGPGEFFGTRQSGVPDLKVAKLSDVAVLEAARRQAQIIFEQDPLLEAPEHAALAAQVEALWQRGAEGA